MLTNGHFNFLFIVKYLRPSNESEYEMFYVVRRAEIYLVFLSGCVIRRLCICPLSEYKDTIFYYTWNLYKLYLTINSIFTSNQAHCFCVINTDSKILHTYVTFPSFWESHYTKTIGGQNAEYLNVKCVLHVLRVML